MLILGTNSIKDTGYTVANSCRFNSGDSAYLSKTFSDGGSSRKTFTLSYWIKRTELGNEILFGGAGGDAIYFTGTDELLVAIGSGTDDRRESDMKFRDIGAWYHIVQKFDTTQGTAANRYTLYVNGTVATTNVVSGKNDITEDDDVDLFYGGASYIGFDGSAYGSYYLSEMVHIDGSALAASSFGEFDEDSPTIWKPKDISGLTFGTNGFYLDFEDSGDLGDDESGNTNDFAENNIAATDSSTDSPTNNFATLNALQTIGTAATLSEGNLKITVGSSNWAQRTATIAANAGKWYAECKVDTIDNTYAAFGIIGVEDHQINRVAHPHGAATGVCFQFDYRDDQSAVAGNDTTILSNEVNIADDDIMGFAMDLDNGKLYWHKNGTYINSGDPTTGATGTGAVNVPTAGIYYYITYGVYNGAILLANFGNPIVALSSAVADADGYGAFEFAPPSGYFALNTKNLAEYG